jgi:hypothetical protein
MGSSGSSLELAAKLQAAANRTAASEARKRAINAAALAAKDTYNKHASAAGLRVGSKLAGRSWSGFGYKLVGNDHAIVSPRGPVHLHNAPTRPHRIDPKGERTATGRKRRVAGADSLLFGGEHYAGVDHPGTKGKGWGKGAKAAIAKQSPEAYQRSMSSEWRAVFK